jgi:tetratricopeptide (TPR) repeat protein
MNRITRLSIVSGLILFCLLLACMMPVGFASRYDSPRIDSTQIPSSTLSYPTPAYTSTFDWWSGHPPTVTVVQYIPITLTPTAVTPVMTVTPGPAAICPVISHSNIDLNIELPAEKHQSHEAPILDFLNKGGSVTALQRELKENMLGYKVLTEDITNDGIPEVIVQPYSLYVYTCIQGGYQTALVEDPIEYSVGLQIIDINQNGIPELIISKSYAPASPIYQYQILEWDGQKFSNLLAKETLCSRYNLNGCIENGVPDIMVGFDDLEDIDHDGMLEFLITGGVGFGADTLVYQPQRNGTMIWDWDGHAYHLSSIQLSPPHYRIQALQDGDEYSLGGDYDNALASYWRVIEDDSLDWWSPSRRQYNMVSIGNQTPIPTPVIDTNERIRLSAYAYYRIMLIHVVRGEMEQAGMIFDRLQTEITDAGFHFKVLATVFWNEYTKTHQMESSCQRAIEYVRKNPKDTIDKLDGYYYYIISNHTYVPEDVCPFK